MRPQNTREEKIKDSLLQLSSKAISEISSSSRVTIQFCGPISSGGFGNVEENLRSLSSIIKSTKSAGIPGFNQLAYERQFDAILGPYHGYDYPLLEYFYGTILSSGVISALIFLPLWDSSVGSRWEHDYANSLGIPVFYIERLLLSEIEAIYKKIESHSRP